MTYIKTYFPLSEEDKWGPFVRVIDRTDSSPDGNFSIALYSRNISNFDIIHSRWGRSEYEWWQLSGDTKKTSPVYKIFQGNFIELDACGWTEFFGFLQFLVATHIRNNFRFIFLYLCFINDLVQLIMCRHLLSIYKK